ncbi:COP9 signalosome complex subunit 5 [Diplonema papillatum]|nr:COP9 signalosome complex subunit 5 [Diplonema papillatum]
MTGGGAAPSTSTSQKQWEANNTVKATDEYYRGVDPAKMKQLHKEAPWKQRARHFTKVKMSALALVKIVMHAKTGKGKAGRISSDSGNWIEVMGVMQGYVENDTFVILDSFALPVEAHEVECYMNQAATEYLITYIQYAEQIGKGEPMVGWYHSHPGYRCFLSKMDCTGQRRYQQYSDPFVAVVIDPVRTISTGKVEIKAFRTLPENQVADAALPSEATSSGTNDKIEELGVYAHWYYELPIEVFKSSADEEALRLLWGKFWSSTLASSPLLTNRFFIDRQIFSLEKQLAQSASDVGRQKDRSGAGSSGSRTVGEPAEPTQLQKTGKASDHLSGEVLHGLLGVVVKDAVFNLTSTSSP